MEGLAWFPQPQNRSARSRQGSNPVSKFLSDADLHLT